MGVVQQEQEDYAAALVPTRLLWMLDTKSPQRDAAAAYANRQR
jgi:hypothetical protein